MKIGNSVSNTIYTGEENPTPHQKIARASQDTIGIDWRITTNGLSNSYNTSIRPIRNPVTMAIPSARKSPIKAFEHVSTIFDQPLALESIFVNSAIVSPGPGNRRLLETSRDATNHTSRRKPTERIGASCFLLEEESI